MVKKLMPPSQTILFALTIGMIGLSSWLWQQYQHGQQARSYAKMVLEIRPFLAGNDSFRRRVGLWPVASAFSPPEYRDNATDHGKKIGIMLDGHTYAHLPYAAYKVIMYDLKIKCPLWERDDIQLPTANRPADSTLSKTYSYEAAARGHNPWAIRLRGRFGYHEDTTLSLNQADSLLRRWRMRGQQDSIAHMPRR